MIEQTSSALFNQAIAYLEGHLTAPASIAETAAQVGYSRHHFSRLFLALIGLSPAAYLRKRRLSEAARELISSSKRILDIALDYQFQSQEAFTRSFKREFGVSPGHYRWRGRLRRCFQRITLNNGNRLLYPGRGIDPKLPLLTPAPRLTVVSLALATPAERREKRRQDGLPVSTERVTIRQAHRQDIPALCRRYHELHQVTIRGVPDRLQSLGDFDCFDAAGLVQALEKLLGMIEVIILVAEVAGQVVGLAEVYLRTDETNPNIVARRYGYLQSLVVEPRQRGRGIGRRLLAAAEAWSKTHGASELRLDCWEFDEGPLAFYEQQGYRTLARTIVRRL